MLTNAGQIINVKYLYRHIYAFHGFKIDFMTHKKTIENKNKEKKHTFNSVDGGFDITFYYIQNKLK